MLKNSFQFGELIIKRKLTSAALCAEQRRRKRHEEKVKENNFEEEIAGFVHENSEIPSRLSTN